MVSSNPETFSCLIDLQDCSPISSHPGSPASSIDDGTQSPAAGRHLTRTCSSLVPSLLIDQPELVLYTAVEPDRARRSSSVYQNYLCEEPLVITSRPINYQEKYQRYMNKIASIDSIDHLSNESIDCLEGYLSPCYRQNAMHFVKAYQLRIREQRRIAKEEILRSRTRGVRRTSSSTFGINRGDHQQKPSSGSNLCVPVVMGGDDAGRLGSKRESILCSSSHSDSEATAINKDQIWESVSIQVIGPDGTTTSTPTES